MNEINNLSKFESILLSTDGTVTDLISHYTGENIQVTKLAQDFIRDDKPAALELIGPEALLHREILLSGKNHHYLYAESFFVISRMSDYLQTELLKSNVPIGLLWQREKLETFREIIAWQQEECNNLHSYFKDLMSNPKTDLKFLSRQYKIYHGGKILGLITEKFPQGYFR